MPTNVCRICGNELFDKPLLRFENMPAAAQFLPDAESLKRDKGTVLEVCQCSGCGVVELNSDPVPYYRDVIRAAGFSEEMREYRRKQFSLFIDRYSLGGKKILELGCGCGEYLSIMADCGVDAYGLEHCDESVHRCIEQGLKVSQGFMERDSSGLHGAPFDSFFILSYLEHLPDPNSTLRGIFANLGDNAVGLVEVPNFDMILRKNLFSEFIADHLFYFTKDTLSSLLSLNGFEIVECRETWYDYIISAVVRKKRPIDISHFHDIQAGLAEELKSYINKFDPGRVAVWGAGHQALALISLANIAGRIKYVIDSAPFKQGKYTPATHIPIVSPGTLRSEPVDAIIVMASSYSDEVAAIIRGEFDKRINVYILRDYGLEIAGGSEAYV